MDAFDSCLKNGRLAAKEPDPDLIQREINTAGSELTRARTCYADGRFEECVVQGYFAMYRVLRALLLQEGYRDTNLYSLIAGIERLLVRSGRMEGRLLEILRLAKDQKDLVQQGGRCTRKETQLILSGAEETWDIAGALLELAGLPPLEPEGRREDEVD